MKYLIIHIIVLFSLSIFSQKIENSYVENLYKVDNNIYRSAQPNKNGMKYLDSLGIKTILNLRHIRTDKREAKKISLTLKKVSINTWKMNEQDIIDALKIIKESKKPVLIHCLHGSDRTGAVVASYRIIFQNWTKKQAIDEMLKQEYGFHIKSFQHIFRLVENLNVEKVKNRL